MSVKITYFVHGTTFDNESHKATGWQPGELSPKGVERTLALKEKIDINKYDIVFCSDLKRAIDSANNVFGGEKEIVIDDRIRECNYGDLEGKDNDTVIYEEHIEENFPDGESLLDVEMRVRDFLEDVKSNYSGKVVGIVAHRAPQLALEVITKNISWEEAIKNDWRKTGDWQPGWEYTI